jgi:hypothetical protein
MGFVHPYARGKVYEFGGGQVPQIHTSYRRLWLKQTPQTPKPRTTSPFQVISYQRAGQGHALSRAVFLVGGPEPRAWAKGPFRNHPNTTKKSKRKAAKSCDHFTTINNQLPGIKNDEQALPTLVLHRFH